MPHPTLRHLLTTAAYRLHIALDGSDQDFGDFNAGNEVRTPNQLLRHMSYILLAVQRYLEVGTFKTEKIEPQSLADELKRMLASIESLDATLEQITLTREQHDRLVQGPLSDILTHIGQIAMLRRLSGNPVQPASNFSADLTTGTFHYGTHIGG
jgi:hypothetical protein